MKEPSMKQLWAGMAMLALLLKKPEQWNFADIAADAWRMADMMEEEEKEREE